MKWTLLALLGGAVLWTAAGQLRHSGRGNTAVGDSRVVSGGGFGVHSVNDDSQPLVADHVEAGAGDESPSDVSPSGVYLEARDATVWGGACHISSEAVSHGCRAAMGWSFTGGSHGGVDLAGTQVVAVLEGTSNLQASEVFGTDERPEVSSQIWVDAPSELVRDAALAFVCQVADLGSVLAVHLANVTVDFDDDQFVMGVEDSLSVKGEAMPDRSCCTMPESRWYSPLASVEDSVVGNPYECRFEGVAGSLEKWTFEGANSVFVADIAAE